MLLRASIAIITFCAILVGGVFIGQTRMRPYAYIARLEQLVIGHNPSLNTSWELLDTIYQSRPRQKIVVIGDSHVQFGDWPRLLGRPDVDNLGIGGERSNQLQERIKHYDFSCSTVVILIGTNDIGNMTAAESDASIKNIIGYAKQSAKHVIVVAPPPTSNASFNLKVALLRDQDRAACTGTCSFLDMTTVLSDGDVVRPDLSADGVHFKESGYEIIAKGVSDALEIFG